MNVLNKFLCGLFVFMNISLIKNYNKKSKILSSRIK